MTDRYYINIIIRKIEKKLSWKKVSLWTDNEFKKLSILIYEDTSISISPQTLKRLFGKVKYKEAYTTQPATKDALAKFLNYNDWDAFIRDQSHSIFRYINLLNNRISGKYGKRSLLIVFLAIVFIIASVLVISDIKDKPVTFYAANVTGMVPHTVSFHLDLSPLRNKEVYLDFDQNEAENAANIELLDKHLTLINHCFESPGYYNVRLSSKGKVLASAKIHVLSEGWTSYYFNDDNFILRKFIFGLEKQVRDSTDDGILYISPKDLNNKGLNGNTVYYLEHLLYKDFRLSADSCLFEIKYKNSSDIGGISCYDVEFRLVGENGIASVMLVQKGCYRWSEVTIGEKHLNGKYNDLSHLSSDLSTWNIMKISINNHTAAIINNADTIYTSNYNQLLGMIKGIRFVTKGSGAFDYVKLYDNHGKLMFDDNLGNQPR
jgi:hypothetical protein